MPIMGLISGTRDAGKKNTSERNVVKYEDL
jgi:hypothetical protein